MMKRIMLAVLLCIPFGVMADELDDGYQTCLPHKNDMTPRVVMQNGRMVADASSVHGSFFQPGWEHCLVIHRAWLQRNAAQVAPPPSDPPPLMGPATPEYQSTLDLANKLKEPPPKRPDATLSQQESK